MTKRKPSEAEVKTVNQAVKRTFKELDRLADVCAKNHSPLRTVSFRNYPTAKSAKNKHVTYASCVHDS